MTFDDGYADNLLGRRTHPRPPRRPATVFVSSGHIDGRREFWWDELERLVLGPGARCRSESRSKTPEGEFSATLLESGTYTPEDAHRDAGWNVLDPSANERQRLYKDLAAFLRPLSAADREASPRSCGQ